MFKLHLVDVLKGAVAAAFGAAVTAIYQLVVACTTFSCIAGFNWQATAQAAALVGVSYLLKNFFSDENGNPLGIKLNRKGAN